MTNSNHPVFGRIHVTLITMQYADHARVYTGFNHWFRPLYGYSIKPFPRKLRLVV